MNKTVLENFFSGCEKIKFFNDKVKFQEYFGKIFDKLESETIVVKKELLINLEKIPELKKNFNKFPDIKIIKIIFENKNKETNWYIYNLNGSFLKNDIIKYIRIFLNDSNLFWIKIESN